MRLYRKIEKAESRNARGGQHSDPRTVPEVGFISGEHQTVMSFEL
jgi:hypothetical protein